MEVSGPNPDNPTITSQSNGAFESINNITAAFIPERKEKVSTQLAISATNQLIDKEKVLAEFGEYARVDLHLAKRTVYERKLHIFHFLDAVNDIYSTPAVRTFLGQFADQHYKYENYLKALEVILQVLRQRRGCIIIPVSF